MKLKFRLIAVAFFIIPFAGYSQDTLVHKLDSLNRRTDSAGGQENNINPHAYDEQTHIFSGVYFTLLGSDLKQEFTKPFHMVGRDWGNLGKAAVVGGALAFLDRPIQRYSQALVVRNPFIHDVSKVITNFGGPYEAFTLGAFGAYGIIFKNPKMKTTTLLATQAYITGGALESVVKYISGRTRPTFYGTDEVPRPRFLGPFSKTGKDATGSTSYSSFPSGHTTVAFAAATVFALEYSDKPWVPIIAYSSAGLIGLSRITENKHWATDVFAGALVGYLAGRNVVNNYHRYAKLKVPGRKGNKPVSFNMQYQYGHLMPGLTYKL